MKKNLVIGIAIIGGILLLAGAAFLGAKLLAPAQGEAGLGNLPIGPGGGPVSQMAVKLNILPAEEIPTRSPEIGGLIGEIKDNSLLVQSIEGGEAVSLSVGKDGQTKVEAPTGGPTTEIVVTQETQIYRETTFDDRASDQEVPGGGADAIQQTVESITLSDLVPNQHVRVWGYKRGDRIVAEVILTSAPVTFRR